jgi:hypothetical protein
VSRVLSAPAGPVRDHILALIAGGMTGVDIAAAARVDTSTVNRIRRGENRRVHIPVATAILAVQLLPIIRPAPPGYVDPTRPRRQLQALAAIGHRWYDMARQLPMSRSRFHHLICGHSHYTSASAAIAIDALYRELRDTAGTSTHAASRARVHGWPPPSAWYDDTIGDPATPPDIDGATPTIDEMFVELALAGDTAVADLLSPAERRHAARLAEAQAVSSRVTRRLVSERTLQRRAKASASP